MANQRRWAAPGRLALILFLVGGVPAGALAELTVADLTGTAVAGVGPYHQDVSDAIKAFGGRDFAKALNHLQNAKKLTPALAPPEVMMAQLHFHANQPLQGIAMLERAMQTSADDPEAYVIAIERALAEGRLSEAELLFAKTEKLVASFSQNPRRKQNAQLRAYTAGAAIDEARGRLDAAKSKLEALVKLDPRSAATHERLGRVLYAVGSEEARRRAWEEFKLAAELDPAALPADLQMAMLSSEKTQAQRWLNFAIQRSPDDLRTQLSAANYFLQASQLDEARRHAGEAVKLDPDGFDSNFIAGIAARMDGDYAAAERHLSKAHLLQPANPIVVNHLALTLLDLPGEVNQRRALQYAELNARQHSDKVDYLATLGWVNYRLKRLTEAERAFAAVFNSPQVKATQTMTSEMGYYLANLARAQGNNEEAVKMLREALNTDQPFAYRKKAEELLAQLTKTASPATTTTPTATQSNPTAP